MAAYNYSFFVLSVLCLVTSNAAPAEDVGTVLKLPAACKGQQFCPIKPEGYELLEEKINNALPEFLLNEYSQRNGPETPSQDPELSPTDDWHNCPYETKTQSMFLFNHGENETKYDIFVQTDRFKQYVDIVTCATKHIDIDSDEQCFQDLGVSAFSMKSTCVTTKAKRPFYVYVPETNKVVQKLYEVPVCCSCKVFYNLV